MGQTPIKAVYPTADAGDDITLYAGPMSIAGVNATGRVWLQTNGNIKYRWEMDSHGSAMELGDAEIVFSHPELGPVQLRTRVTSSCGLGEITWSTLGAANSLDEVVIHWMDLPSVLPADPLDDGVSTWSGRWSATGGGWALTLDSRPDYIAVAAAAAGHPVHVVTHVASLRRQDGSTFTPAEAEDALEAWQSIFSFALGRWVPPMLAVGPVVQFDLSKYKFIEEMQVAAGLDSRPDLLALKPVEFEHLIRELFEAVGMKSWVTQASRDDGVDGVAVNEDPVVGLLRHGGLVKHLAQLVGGQPLLVLRATSSAIKDVLHPGEVLHASAGEHDSRLERHCRLVRLDDVVGDVPHLVVPGGVRPSG
jgi:Restriction endonuclease